LHAFWIYLAIAFGSLLAWSVTVGVRVFIVLAVATWMTTARSAWQRARVPLSLPLGIWIAACLSGWLREEAILHCDDVLRARAQPGVEIAVATSADESTCTAGRTLAVARYPRKLWEAPGGARLVFTTQTGDRRVSPLEPAPGRLPNSICEAQADGSGEPRCVGAGKAHGIVDAPDRDRLFVAAWGLRTSEDDASRDGVVYELTRVSPLQVVRERRLRSAGDLFYEPLVDRLGTLSDEGFEMVPLSASTLEPQAPVPTPINPGEVRYDASRHEGVFCFAAGPLRTIDGGAFFAVAFRGEPYSFRPLGGSASYPSAWLALSWGCDWDPIERRVYATIPNLGLLATLDYDTGRILSRRFVGLGLRSVAYDRARRRVYLTNFLAGDVIAVDIETGREVGRWFAGRFAREVRLSHRGDAIFVTSNVGIVRIPL
jgi:hypothetical protein